MNNLCCNKRGFSLVEILVSLALLAMFVTVTIPLLTGSFERIMIAGQKSESTYISHESIEQKILKNKDGTDTFEFNFERIDLHDIKLENNIVISNVKKIDIDPEEIGRDLITNLLYFQGRGIASSLNPNAFIPNALKYVFDNEMALFASLGTGSESKPAIEVTGSAKICGTLGTNATGLNSINFGSSSNISVNGDLYIGYDANPDDVITVKGWGRTIDDVITEGHIVENNTEVVLFPSLVFPAFPNDLLVGRADFKTPSNPGGYINEDGRYDLIEVTASRTLTIDLQGGTRVLQTKKFNIQGTVELKNVGTDGKLLLYIVEEFSTSGNRNINVTGDGAGNPAAFNVFIKGYNSFPSNPSAPYNFVGNVFTEYGDVFIGSSSSFIGHIATLGEKVTISGSADSNSGLIYAPNAKVSILGSGSVRGTIVGESLIASGGNRCAIIYDYPDMSSFTFEFETN